MPLPLLISTPTVAFARANTPFTRALCMPETFAFDPRPPHAHGTSTHRAMSFTQEDRSIASGAESRMAPGMIERRGRVCTASDRYASVKSDPMRNCAPALGSRGRNKSQART
jgi:hypothetical protein